MRGYLTEIAQSYEVIEGMNTEELLQSLFILPFELSKLQNENANGLEHL
jgi:hypothetical protein